MRKWKNIIIHHSASNWGTARVIDHWHKQRGWNGIGYHFVILNGYLASTDYNSKRQFHSLIGSIETGRPLNLNPWVEVSEIGAHALGFNKDSIGICLIHKDGLHHSHVHMSLIKLVDELRRAFNIKIENIKGHYEVNSNKPDCPSIDMNLLRKVIGGITHE